LQLFCNLPKVPAECGAALHGGGQRFGSRKLLFCLQNTNLRKCFYHIGAIWMAYSCNQL
jgi:hypothetical protein